jgi:hypothetical protein
MESQDSRRYEFEGVETISHEATDSWELKLLFKEPSMESDAVGKLLGGYDFRRSI